VVLAILSLSSIRRKLQNLSTTHRTSTTENLYSLLNGIHRSLYIRYEGQNETGIAGCMQQVDIAGEDIVYQYLTAGFYKFITGLV
jgi:hypothetical protein